jgi:NTE family protein
LSFFGADPSDGTGGKFSVPAGAAPISLAGARLRRRSLLLAAAAGAPVRAAAGPPRLGFALGSGALHGFAHIGIVRGCARLGLRPHAIAGTSVGAAVGALWAAGLGADAIARIAQRLDWSAGAATALGRLLFGRRRNEPLYAEIERAVGGRRIEELPTRFAAVATDLNLGEPVVLDAGEVAPAVAASSAVPVWFEPVRIGSHALIDGSLTAPVPVEAARQLGAQRIVAVDIAFRPYEEAPSGALDHAFQALHIATNALAREQTRSAEHLIQLDLHHLMHGRFDPEALIDAGEQALLAIGPALRGG